MAFFKVKVEDTTYELDKMTLGEARILKREFGLTDLSSFSGTDPDQLVGLLYLALKRENPAMTHDEALAEVEGLDIEGFETPAPDEEAVDEDPTQAGTANGNNSDDSATPSLETTPEPSGDPS
jgi:hypothetical protein